MFFPTRRYPIPSIYLSVHLNLICAHLHNLRQQFSLCPSVSSVVNGTCLGFDPRLAPPRLLGEYFFAVTLRAFCEEWGSMHFVTVRSRTLANESEQPRVKPSAQSV